jgi:hypothetical protein
MFKSEHIVQPVISAPANADMLTEKLFVKLLSTGKAAICGAGEMAIGVLQLPASKDEMASIVTAPSVINVIAGGDVAIGEEVVSDASGKAVKATDLSVSIPADSTPVTSDGAQPTLVVAGGALPEKILGVALDAGGDGDLIRVKLK